MFSLLVDDDHTWDIIVRETLTTELTATNTGRQADPSCPPYQYAEPHLPVLQIHIGMHALMQNTILLELRMHVGFVKRVKVFFGHISSKMKQCIKIWETFDATDLAATVVGGDGTIPYLHKWSTGIGKFCTLEYSASGKYTY